MGIVLWIIAALLVVIAVCLGALAVMYYCVAGRYGMIVEKQRREHAKASKQVDGRPVQDVSAIQPLGID